MGEKSHARRPRVGQVAAPHRLLRHVWLTSSLLCKSELQHLGKFSRGGTIGTSRRRPKELGWGGVGGGGFCVNVIYYEASLCLHSLRSQVHFRVCLISANQEMCQAARAEQATAVRIDVRKR